MLNEQQETDELLDILGLHHDASLQELAIGDKSVSWQEIFALLPAWRRNQLKTLAENSKNDSVEGHL